MSNEYTGHVPCHYCGKAHWMYDSCEGPTKAETNGPTSLLKPKRDGRVRSSERVRRRTLPPLMPYDQWRALGPEKAAEYLARRRGYSAERQGKLWAILEFAWNEPPNDQGQR